LMAYLRQDDKDTILVALNFSGMKKKLNLPKTSWEVLCSEHRKGEIIKDELFLLPYEVILLKENKEADAQRNSRSFSI